MQEQAIGFFDSGWGGLSIFNTARTYLPKEDMIYVADCGHAPYGDQTHDFIVNRALSIANFLFNEQKVKAIVVACNTATVESIQELRHAFPNRIILGVEPAIKPAVESSKNNSIGLIATTRTVTSTRYQELLKLHANNVKVFSQGCPGLMECVETGQLQSHETIELLHSYLDPMIDGNIDALVLGCTHYPFLAETIRGIIGDEVQLFEPSYAVAKHLKNQLLELNALQPQDRQGNNTFFVSDLNDERKKVAQSLSPYATLFSELNC